MATNVAVKCISFNEGTFYNQVHVFSPRKANLPLNQQNASFVFKSLNEKVEDSSESRKTLRNLQ